MGKTLVEAGLLLRVITGIVGILYALAIREMYGGMVSARQAGPEGDVGRLQTASRCLIP